MTIKKRTLTAFAVFLCIAFSANNFLFAAELFQSEVKYPDYGKMYLGEDKCENFNRKMFRFNGALNRYAIRPIHTVWASVMPKYGMDRIQSAHTNMVYPRRLMSTLIQKDFKAAGSETVRFLTNTTIGLGGLYDPAKKIFKIEPVDEDMEQALAKCKLKQGPYLVIPVLTSSTPRDLAGKLLDWALDPSSYVGTPVLAMVKAGLTLNRTSYMQPLVKMLESTYADPYDIARKLYGIENHIKCANYDRPDVLRKMKEAQKDNSVAFTPALKEFTSLEDDIFGLWEEPEEENILSLNNTSLSLYDTIDSEVKVADNTTKQENLASAELFRGGAEIIDEEKTDGDGLHADMVLEGYNPQNPVVDSMRTALFDLPGINKSIWAEISVWNRCFSKKIKMSSVNIDPQRENYRYRYILQKDKTAPMAVVYPSIGEGIMSYHSVVLAKLFYDAGYSVIIQGSNFQWEFVKSMPKEYKPGIPSRDAEYLRNVTSKILASLEKKYECKPKEKVLIGTSFGALTTLFIAEKESKNNTLGITKYISINPPVELLYAMNQIDKNTAQWKENTEDLKNMVALTAAKVIQVTHLKDEPDAKIESLPFSEEEAKLITGFIMHQKLSDLVFALEESPQCKKCGIYENVNNMDYHDYAGKYLMSGNYATLDEMSFDTSLHSIADFLKSNNNYKIYHTLDDYLVNRSQLKELKKYCGSKTVLIDHGSHLGFLYRPEFIQELKKDISLGQDVIVENKG